MATSKNGFDLRALHLGEKNVAFFALKRDAVAFAKSCGWSPRDVSFAFNRFNAFWVVAQVICDDLRILRKDGGVLDIPHPGRA